MVLFPLMKCMSSLVANSGPCHWVLLKIQVLWFFGSYTIIQKKTVPTINQQQAGSFDWCNQVLFSHWWSGFCKYPSPLIFLFGHPPQINIVYPCYPHLFFYKVGFYLSCCSLEFRLCHGGSGYYFTCMWAPWSLGTGLDHPWQKIKHSDGLWLLQFLLEHMLIVLYWLVTWRLPPPSMQGACLNIVCENRNSPLLPRHKP